MFGMMLKRSVANITQLLLSRSNASTNVRSKCFHIENCRTILYLQNRFTPFGIKNNMLCLPTAQSANQPARQLISPCPSSLPSIIPLSLLVSSSTWIPGPSYGLVTPLHLKDIFHPRLTGHCKGFRLLCDRLSWSGDDPDRCDAITIQGNVFFWIRYAQKSLALFEL